MYVFSLNCHLDWSHKGVRSVFRGAEGGLTDFRYFIQGATAGAGVVSKKTNFLIFNPEIPAAFSCLFE